MLLEIVDRDHAAGFLNIHGELVDGTRTLSLPVHLTNLQDVVQTIKCDLNDLIVHHRQQVTQGLYATLVDEIADLGRLGQASGRGVGNGPTRFFLRLEISILEDVDKRGNEVGINDRLDLGGGTSGDVGDRPAGFLPDPVFGRREKRKESGQGTRRNNDLGLEIVAGHDIADGSQGGCLDGCRRVHEELHQSATDTRLNDGLDLVVGSIGKVGDRPACIDQDLVVQRVDELGENSQSRGDLGRE